VKEYGVLGFGFFLIGLIILISDLGITGLAIGTTKIKYNLYSLFGLILILFSLIILTIKSDLERIILDHDWSTFAINKESILMDIEQEYLSNIKPQASSLTN